MSKLPPQTLPIALITQDSIRKGEGIFLLFAHIAFITSISCVRPITASDANGCDNDCDCRYTQPSTVSIERAFLALMRRQEEFIFHYTIIPPHILFVLPAGAAISNIVRHHTIIVLHDSIPLRCSLLHFPLQCPRFLLAHHR